MQITVKTVNSTYFLSETGYVTGSDTKRNVVGWFISSDHTALDGDSIMVGRSLCISDYANSDAEGYHRKVITSTISEIDIDGVGVDHVRYDRDQRKLVPGIFASDDPAKAMALMAKMIVARAQPQHKRF